MSTQIAPVYSAARIAELLTVPPATPLTPTPEQQRVIEHPLDGSALVVAGAGSGKTETMANRVVWLVANGLVAPDEVLGLTFTRKAAGELRERIAGRLATFAERLVDARERGALTEPEAARADDVIELLADGLELPEVSTYNAFAAAVLQEFGVAAGVAPGASIIDDATAWGMARGIVRQSRDPELVRSKLPLSKIVNSMLQLDHAVSDNLTSFDRVDQVIAEFCRVDALPYNEKVSLTGRDGKLYAPVRDAIASLSDTPLITRLAREYSEEKMRLGLLEFADQLALASKTLEKSAEAINALRKRYGAVLLDEVQDTSVGQTRFLSKIFSGMPVMAVGDPHQSIYGWRGASAEGLTSFHQDFAPVGKPARGETLSLSTSWRNPVSVLTAANAVAAPLVAESAVHVPTLASRPGAPDGTVEAAYFETVHEEREALATWMRDARIQHLKATGESPTAAVIFRNRGQMPAFSAALTKLGVPNRIVGLGGLLTTPEVTDIVSVLRCVWFADAASDLIRLLTGPRFRVGVADIAGLKKAARWFGDRDVNQQKLTDADVEADRVLPDPDRAFTLVDALDQLSRSKTVNRIAFEHVSDLGIERMRDAGRMLAELRLGVGGSITELIGEVVLALRLDVELDANEARETAGTSAAHANIDAFIDIVTQFLSIDGAATLSTLLDWIERATEADEVAEHVSAPTPDTVHLITAHGSKGLEWDLVALPRWASDEFPSTPRRGLGWLRTGELPDELRGDVAARPELNWRLATTQKELVDRIAEYKEALKERQLLEERRLAYVAVTRSALRLFICGSFWGGQTRQRPPSPFLAELAEAGVVPALPAASEHEADPSALEELTLSWPLDPLGARAQRVRAAAELVLAELGTEPFSDASALAVPAAGSGGADDAEAAIDLAASVGDPDRGAFGALAPGAGADPGDSVDALGGADDAARADGGAKLASETAVPHADHSDASKPGVEVAETVRLLLAELAAQQHAAGLAPLPERITASSFHEFVEDPRQAERARLRPVPQRPFRRTRVGNLFHEWVERRATTARGTALTLAGFEPELWVADEPEALDARDDESIGQIGKADQADHAVFNELSGADAELDWIEPSLDDEFDPQVEAHSAPQTTGDAESDAEALRPLIEQFEASRWADRQPIAVELEVVLPFAGRSLVCKLDAVYQQGDRIEVVDWKSGRSPKNTAERESRFFQLDLYRHAYAQWAGIDPELIDVTLFYVGEGVELQGIEPRSLDELERIWLAAADRRGSVD